MLSPQYIFGYQHPLIIHLLARHSKYPVMILVSPIICVRSDITIIHLAINAVLLTSPLLGFCLYSRQPTFVLCYQRRHTPNSIPSKIRHLIHRHAIRTNNLYLATGQFENSYLLQTKIVQVGRISSLSVSGDHSRETGNYSAAIIITVPPFV